MVENNKHTGCVLSDSNDIILHNAKLSQAFGTSSSELQDYFMNQFTQVFQECSSITREDEDMLAKVYNTAITIFHELQPCNVLEVMLITQMIGVHNMTIELLHNAILPDKRFNEKESYSHLVIKLLRTFTQQMDTLKNLRQKNPPKGSTEEVEVKPAGGKIVDSVSDGGWRIEKSHE